MLYYCWTYITSVDIYLTDKPEPPSNFNVQSITADSITVSWSAPLSDGGSDVTKYVVEKREDKRSMWQPVGTTEQLELEVTGLYEGNQYNFHVMAENAVGLSEPVELKDMVT